jgi:hypothetical protein
VLDGLVLEVAVRLLEHRVIGAAAHRAVEGDAPALVGGHVAQLVGDERAVEPVPARKDSCSVGRSIRAGSTRVMPAGTARAPLAGIGIRVGMASVL